MHESWDCKVACACAQDSTLHHNGLQSFSWVACHADGFELVCHAVTLVPTQAGTVRLFMQMKKYPAPYWLAVIQLSFMPCCGLGLLYHAVSLCDALQVCLDCTHKEQMQVSMKGVQA